MMIIVFWILLIFLLYGLQTSISVFTDFEGFNINLMLPMIVSTTFLRGRDAGILTGFVAGVLQDVISGSFFGCTIFSYMVIGLIFGESSRNFFRNQMLLPMLNAIPAFIIHSLLITGLLFLLGQNVNIDNFISANFLRLCFIQLVFAYPIHKLVCLVNRYSKEKFIGGFFL